VKFELGGLVSGDDVLPWAVATAGRLQPHHCDEQFLHASGCWRQRVIARGGNSTCHHNMRNAAAKDASQHSETLAAVSSTISNEGGAEAAAVAAASAASAAVSATN